MAIYIYWDKKRKEKSVTVHYTSQYAEQKITYNYNQEGTQN